MGVNPFEPPRAPADQAPATGEGIGALPEAAFGELVASIPWVRWAARLSLIGIIASVLNAAVTAGRAAGPAEAIGGIAGALVGLAMAFVFLLLFRRYARHAERLPTRQAEALSGVLDGQRSIFLAYGVLSIIGFALGGLLVILGIVAAIVARAAR